MAMYRRLLADIPEEINDQLIVELYKLKEEWPAYRDDELMLKMLADREIALQTLKRGKEMDK